MKITPTIRSIVTSVLIGAGSFFTAKGVISQQELEVIAASLVTIIGVVWDAVAAKAIQGRVKEIQKDAGALIDGVLGPKTVAKIKQLADK
jgi:hypothetical protein